ncbi:hypothetical protein D3C85_1070810 [compost metagenome]
MVGEFGLGPNRPGVGADLVVDQAQGAFGQQAALRVAVTAEVSLDDGRRGRVDQCLQGGQQLLRQGELHPYGVDLGDGEKPLAVRDPEEVADVDIADADTARDRRANLGVGQLHLGRGDGGLVTQHRSLELVEQRLLLVEGLPRYAVVDAEQPIALEVDLGHL